jgi:hypothetical protein
MEATHKGRSGLWAGAAGFMVILGVLSLASMLSKHTFTSRQIAEVRQVAEVSRIARSDTDTDKLDETFPQMAELSGIARSDSDTDKRERLVPLKLEYYGFAGNDSTDLGKVLDARPPRRRLGSYEERLAEARRLRDIIRERKLVIFVELHSPGLPGLLQAIGPLTDTPCAAARRVVFTGGVRRFMAPEELAQENEAGRRGWFAFGVWVRAGCADHADSTPSDSIQWPTSEELREAGVITGVASLDDLEVWLRQGSLR